MMGKRKGQPKRDPENLKRFRTIVEQFVEDAATGDGKKKPTQPPKSERGQQARRGSSTRGAEAGKNKNRKLRRREERKLKKVKNCAYHQRKHVPSMDDYQKAKNLDAVEKRKQKREEKKQAAELSVDKHDKIEEVVVQKKEDVRKLRLLQANKQDERIMKQIEKQMRMKKKQNLPKSFLDDGLDYILDAIDSDKLYSSYDQSSDEDGEEIPEKESRKSSTALEEETGEKSDEASDDDDMEIDQLSDETSDESSESDVDEKSKRITVVESEKTISKPILKTLKKDKNRNKSVSFGVSVQKDSEDSEDGSESEEEHIERESEDEKESNADEDLQTDEVTFKEDIYGRLRDTEGNIIVEPKTSGAYVPPGKRLQMAGGNDAKRQQKLERLKRQLKGLVNRASEANIQPISNQIEEIFQTNSRADVSESLCSIVMEACVSTVMTPDRLVMELAMLLAILHGNVGPEVGACFIQNLAKQFQSLQTEDGTYGKGKEMDNIIAMFAHLYNFKVIHSQMLFELLKIFTESFREKDIELILLILKNVGFTLRRDDPGALKEMIVNIQSKANSVDTSEFAEKSRVRFMLETIMAVRNNNMRKIPNYDPTHLEHLRKLIRSYVRGGKLIDNQLRISLSDILKAEKSGRWWLVGSAWSGGLVDRQTDAETPTVEGMTVTGVTSSSTILDSARKQRMNTDTRKTIFCTIMSSEDFLDAFERLLKLGLKHKQERELVYVIVDCCCQEKKFNPFYGYVLQKFCEYDRRFQMTFQFHFWDKFSLLSELSEQNLTNLSKLLIHLIASKAVSLSILKTVEFGTLEKAMVRFLKILLLGILLDYPDHVTSDVFGRIAPLTKLHSLHEGLKLFMHHFLLKSKKLKDSDMNSILTERVKVAEKSLTGGQDVML